MRGASGYRPGPLFWGQATCAAGPTCIGSGRRAERSPGGLTGDRFTSCRSITALDEDDAFETVVSELTAGYEAFTGSDLGWVVEQILEFRWSYFDGNLTTWTADEVRTLLFDLYPAKSTLEASEPSRGDRRVRRVPALSG